jgi:hypothetical protein
MTIPTTAAVCALLAGAPLVTQVPKEPAADLSVHRASLPGLEVRFVDYHWQPDLLAAMAKGPGEVAEARRDWVLARVVVESRPLALEGVTLPAGNYALSLWPNHDGKGMAVEMRLVDMRDLYPRLNVIAPTPPGRTVYKGPARFEVQDPPAPRLDIAAAEDSGPIVLTIRYGDRRLALTLTR